MKKLRLRKEVKKGLKTIGMVFICVTSIVALCTLANNLKDEAVEECINSGHDAYYCEVGLS